VSATLAESIPAHARCDIEPCHDDNTALCGADVTDDPWCSDDCKNIICLTCDERDNGHCGCECGCCEAAS
jgi:hypothetical protein